MKKLILTIFISGIYIIVHSQNKKLITSGNKSYDKKDFKEAEISYKKVLKNNPKSLEATYNLGNTIYRKNNMEQALKYYKKANEISNKDSIKYLTYHNIGNTQFQQSKLKEAIEAYKDALRINPNDDQTRYNLALAQHLLKNNKKNNDKNNKDKNDKKDDKKNNDKNNKDKNDKKDDKKNNDKNNKDKNDKKDDDKDKQKNNNHTHPNKQQLNTILQAIKKEEEKTRKRLEKQKANARKTRLNKDW